MPTIQNRSRFIVSVVKHPELVRAFPFTQKAGVTAYLAQLKKTGYTPKVTRANDAFEVRFRQKGHPELSLTCTSEQEAQNVIDRISAERRSGLFIDYSKGWNTTFADLMRRYINEEAPKHKGFEIEAYTLNRLLEDAGLERVDMQAVVNAHPHLANFKLRTSTGSRASAPSLAIDWLHKPFAQLVPTDFEEYIQERLETVAPATVDRDLDLFSAICRTAINTWRIPVQISPMSGVRRPKYFNERDRRLKDTEWQRLLKAARAEDQERSIAVRHEQLLSSAREQAGDKATVYGKKKTIRDARAATRTEAEQSYQHLPILEAFVQFQVMTAARRSEALNLTWNHVDLDEQTAYLPETKNGRPRKLPLRSELIAMLRELPRTGNKVFALSVDYLRKAWARMCTQAAIDDLHIHDLRHEGISQVAETGKFSVIDLQAFSGHRDVRMLMRYAHLCARQLAERLDDAFEAGRTHKGRRRLAANAVPLGEVLPTLPTYNESCNVQKLSPDGAQKLQVSNVIAFPMRLNKS